MMVFANRLNPARFLSYVGFFSIITAIIFILYPHFFKTGKTSSFILSTWLFIMIFLFFRWATKRVHDIGISAKWLWVLFITGGAAFLFAYLTENTVYITRLFLTLGIASFFTLFITIYILQRKPGTNTENAYGPPAPPDNAFTMIFSFFIMCYW